MVTGVWLDAAASATVQLLCQAATNRAPKCQLQAMLRLLEHAGTQYTKQAAPDGTTAREWSTDDWRMQVCVTAAGAKCATVFFIQEGGICGLVENSSCSMVLKQGLHCCAGAMPLPTCIIHQYVNPASCFDCFCYCCSH